VRSLLQNATTIVADKGSLAGEYRIEVPRNERKEDVVDLTSYVYSKELAKSARELCKTFDLGKPRLTQATGLLSTIRINGRPYRQGDYVEFALHVRRTMSVRAAATDSRGVGLIKSFYAVPCGGGGDVALLDRQTMVSVVHLPAKMGPRGTHVLSPGDPGGGLLTERMIHIDNIVFKLHRVPQPLDPEDEDDGGRFFCLRIWEAR